MSIFSKVWNRLRNRKYRKAFTEAQFKRGVPFQIKALRNQRGWSQAKLAEESGLTQGVISRAENPDYGNLTFNTVLEIADGFDVAFIGRFVSYSELAKWNQDLSEDSVRVPSFEDEDKSGQRQLCQNSTHRKESHGN